MSILYRVQFIPLPWRYTSLEAAEAVGCREHDIATLVRTRLLVPLGKPKPNAPKYFSRSEIERLAADPQWLDKVTRAITQKWEAKNQRRNDPGATRLPARPLMKIPTSPSRNSPADQLLSDSKNH